MARIRKDKTSGWDILLVLFFFVFIAYYLIKWAIELISIIIVGIAKLVTRISNKIQKRSNEKNITKKPLVDRGLKIEESLKTPIEIKKEKLDIFDKSIYDSLFPVQIRNRGEVYYYEDKIKYFKRNGNNYSCIVKGNENYNVKLSIDENNNIISSSCTCPYYLDKEHNCKHIYALLYKVKCSENKDKIIIEINNQISSIKTMVKNATDYINRNKSHFSYSVIDEFNDYSQQYILQTIYYEKNCSEKVLEDTLLQHLDNLLNITLELKQKIKKTLNEENSTTDVITFMPKQKKENRIRLTDVMAGIAIANEIFSKENDEEDEPKKENRSLYSEEEMDYYCLEEWQKDLVREGRFAPWSFQKKSTSSDELSDNQYYKDDD